MASLLRAGILAARGAWEAAEEQFREAESALQSREYAHLRRCVTRGRGDLTQRSAGKELIESTDRDMAGQGIRRPERFADMLAPGAAAPQIVTPFSHRNLRLDLAAVAVHRGPYNRMNEAHDAIRKWMAENCRESAGHKGRGTVVFNKLSPDGPSLARSRKSSWIGGCAFGGRAESRRR